MKKYTINDKIMDDLNTLSSKIGTLSDMITFANDRAWDLIIGETTEEKIQIVANLLETLSEVANQRNKDIEAVVEAITHNEG